MQIIDAHHHLWDLDKVEYPWLMVRINDLHQSTSVWLRTARSSKIVVSIAT